MKIHVKESTVVRPAVPLQRPCASLPLSNLDMIVPLYYHANVVYFFQFNGVSNFFDTVVLKAALSSVLVPFYPVAGRLRWAGKRLEIDCNGEGVLFVDAESDGRMDEFGDFSSTPDLNFVPKVDYSKGIGTYPIFLVQVTRFKCGGVCLGIGTDHHVFDGTSANLFMNTWSNMVRGLDVIIPPFLDRTVLSARNPPQPQLPHIEYHPHPSLNLAQSEDPTTPKALFSKRLRLTHDQLNALRTRCNGDYEADTIHYSTFEVVAGHTWRCLTKTHHLPKDQVSKMYIPLNGRSKLRPSLPQEYFGNVILRAMPMVTIDELGKKPLKFCIGKIHDAITQIDHDYVVSALDYLESQRDMASIGLNPDITKWPNLVMVSWAKIPFYDTDFGWGRPVFVCPGGNHEGKVYVMASPVDDASIWIAITLAEDQLKLFQLVFYTQDICNSKI